MQILLATSNPHKIEEVQAVLAPLGIDVVGLNAFSSVRDEPVEDGETFQANARIKAVYYAQQLGCMCLADDSGLEVDALNGAPGVHSARYAAEHEAGFESWSRSERDAANNRRLLRELADLEAEQLTARFVCAMCLADAQGAIVAETRGTFEGVITNQPRGDNGFGYDPLLYLPDVQRTSAELSQGDKNARSHRGAAARTMAEHLRQWAGCDR
jgi:XTP/dITP diphosphohydrolase